MELLILFVLILLNGLFALSEMAVVSSRKVRLQQWADEGRAGAKAALSVANDPSNFLSTIQVGITVIGVTSGAFGEASFAATLTNWLTQWSALAHYAESLALIVVVTGITVASIIVGELVPKRLALLSAERIATVVARPMQVLSRLTYPVVRVLSAVTDGILALFGTRGTEEPQVTEEEINILMEQGAEAGVFEKHEQALVARVFRLDDLNVTGVMTPRSEIVTLDLEGSADANIRRILESRHSRFPVVRGEPNQVDGIVLTKTLFEDSIAGKPLDLASHLVKPLFVPQTLTAMDVVTAFKKHRQTMALVVNEFGDLLGLVTLNDIMEALVGDIATVEDEADRDAVRRDDGSWLIDGSMTIERFKDVIDISDSLPEEDHPYHTVAGFVMLQLGRVPQVGDKFQWGRLQFEVLDMDRNRIDKVLVVVLPEERPIADE
jgi:magnesium and cobalt exporter, CNNM family